MIGRLGIFCYWKEQREHVAPLMAAFPAKCNHKTVQPSTDISSGQICLDSGSEANVVIFLKTQAMLNSLPKLRVLYGIFGILELFTMEWCTAQTQI